MVEMQVRLDPHVGEQETPAGKVKVTLPQKVIMVFNPDTEQWVWSGYVGLEADAHVNIILSGYTPEQLEGIKAAIAKLKGAEPKSLAQAKPLQENDFEVVKEPVAAPATESDIV